MREEGKTLGYDGGTGSTDRGGTMNLGRERFGLPEKEAFLRTNLIR